MPSGRGLGELGYVEGRNMTIEFRSAEGYPISRLNCRPRRSSRVLAKTSVSAHIWPTPRARVKISGRMVMDASVCSVHAPGRNAAEAQLNPSIDSAGAQPRERV